MWACCLLCILWPFSSRTLFLLHTHTHTQIENRHREPDNAFCHHVQIVPVWVFGHNASAETLHVEAYSALLYCLHFWFWNDSKSGLGFLCLAVFSRFITSWRKDIIIEHPSPSHPHPIPIPIPAPSQHRYCQLFYQMDIVYLHRCIWSCSHNCSVWPLG